MTFSEKTLELRKAIKDKLRPLITGNYVLLGLPYHTNIGDSLIWMGAETFFKTTSRKCLYSASVFSYNPKRKIPENALILINGGGSFGDIWRHNTKFWLQLVRQYPDNKIIILPQSIFYKNENLLKEDVEIFSKHKRLTICLRDETSLETANRYFPSVEKLLVPDMAFYLDMTKWKKHVKPASDKVLFLKRQDAEIKQNQNYDSVPAHAETHDWPTMEKTPFSLDLYHKYSWVLPAVDKTLSTHFNNKISDMVYKYIFREKFIRDGVSFLSSYSYIYTTRLHGAILSILLEKPFTWFDNSYGKSSAFYDTWLSDVDDITFIRK